jgi:hypothetical protein
VKERIAGLGCSHTFSLFFLGLDDDLFADLNKRLKSTGAAQYIHGLKEMYVDFKGKPINQSLNPVI